jgi:hypothetical protein
MFYSFIALKINNMIKKENEVYIEIVFSQTTYFPHPSHLAIGQHFSGKPFVVLQDD